MSENNKIGRRAIIAGAVAAAAASGLPPKTEGLEVGAIKLPLSAASLQNFVDTPIQGGHQASMTIVTPGANGITYKNDVVVTRIGNSMTIQHNVTKINQALLKVIGTESYTHTYTGTPVSGGTQVNGNTVANGSPQPALQLTFKGTNPYAGINDPQTLVNAVLKNKRLM